METSWGFGIHPGRRAGAWRCTGPDGEVGCSPAGSVDGPAEAGSGSAGSTCWAEEGVVGNEIIGDRRDNWLSGYDLEGPYVQALKTDGQHKEI